MCVNRALRSSFVPYKPTESDICVSLAPAGSAKQRTEGSQAWCLLREMHRFYSRCWPTLGDVSFLSTRVVDNCHGCSDFLVVARTNKV